MALHLARVLTALLMLPAAGAVASAQAPSSNYRIAPGDVLDVRVLGEPELSTTTRVTNSGTVRVPFVDEDLRVQCLSERDVEAIVTERLKVYLKKPEVHVEVKEFVGSPVAIVGAVTQPGRFQLQRQVNLLELLVFAGGPSEKAGKVIHVIKSPIVDACDPAEAASGESETATETINLARLMDGDVSQNRVMRPGDIVIVPQADLVFVAGEVIKPNAYTLREGLTLTQLLALAGGPSNVAKVDAIRIVRQAPGKAREEIPINLKLVQSGKAIDPMLQANDVVEVPSSSGKKILNGFLSAIGGQAASLPVRVVP